MCLLVSMLMTYLKLKVSGGLSEGDLQYFYYPFSVLNSACIFLTARYLFETKTLSKLFNSAVITIANCTFLVYLIHTIIYNLKNTRSFYIYILADLHLHPLLAVFLECVLIYSVSCLIACVVFKIPYLKKYLK